MPQQKKLPCQTFLASLSLCEYSPDFLLITVKYSEYYQLYSPDVQRVCCIFDLKAWSHSCLLLRMTPVFTAAALFPWVTFSFIYCKTCMLTVKPPLFPVFIHLFLQVSQLCFVASLQFTGDYGDFTTRWTDYISDWDYKVKLIFTCNIKCD